MKATKTTTLLAAVLLSASLEGHCAVNYPGQKRGEEVTYAGERYVKVSTAREFLLAIESGKNILVAPQTRIELTPVLRDTEWCKKNIARFKQLPEFECEDLRGPAIVSEGVDDGPQLTIAGYSDIKITGAGNSHIIVEPRYAFCLNFVNCDNITVSNLTIGHTDEGYCQGGVIGVKRGGHITVEDCSLYGCGTYGVQLENTNNFTMKGSGIHDCTYGIMTLNDVYNAVFEGCNFYRNGQYDLIEARGAEELTFDNCRFYANNSDSRMFAVDGEFTLKNSFVLHPTEKLGTISNAVQADNVFEEDEYDTECIGDVPEIFMGTGNGPEKITVNYKGAKPGVTDFLNATLGYWDNVFEEDGCNWYEDVWERYKKGIPSEGIDAKVLVDERSGYIRISHDGGGTESYNEFCYWNCADGKHKLFATNSGIMNGGKAIETECSGLSFFMYDNATNKICWAGSDPAGLRPVAGDIAYQLPRTGKDITFADGNGKRGTLKWNGSGFGYMQPMSALPLTAQKTDENDDQALYVNRDSDSETSVWLADKKTQTVEKVFVTGTDETKRWLRMGKEDSDGVEVGLNSVGPVENAKLIPWGGRRIMVEGCPDMRNTRTYVIDANTHKGWQLPTTEGVTTMNPDTKEITASSYGYDEEGRYSYQRAYSEDGKYLRNVGIRERKNKDKTMRKKAYALVPALLPLTMLGQGTEYWLLKGATSHEEPVELFLEKKAQYKGIVAGYIRYEKAHQGEPILVAGNVELGWYYLHEYEADGTIIGTLNFRMKPVSGGSAGSVKAEGEWNDPKTNTGYTLKGMQGQRYTRLSKEQTPWWVSGDPLEAATPSQTEGEYSYSLWNPFSQSMRSGTAKFWSASPDGDRLYFDIDNSWQHQAAGVSQNHLPAVLDGNQFEYDMINDCGYAIKATFFRKFVVIETASKPETLDCFESGGTLAGIYIKLEGGNPYAGENRAAVTSGGEIENESTWNVDYLDYTAERNSDGTITFTATDEGEDLGFKLTPTGEAGQYTLSGLGVCENPFHGTRKVKLESQDGQSALCMYDEKGRLRDVLAPLEYECGCTEAMRKWSRQIAGEYTTKRGETVKIGEDNTITLGTTETLFFPQTFNGMVTGVMEIEDGTRLGGLWQVDITTDGLTLHQVKEGEFGGYDRTGVTEKLSWKGNTVPRFGYASRILLNDGQLRRMDKASLRVMRNEILFHHGYRPTSGDLIEYLRGKRWYLPQDSNDGIFNELSLTERLNIELIKTTESYN